MKKYGFSTLISLFVSAFLVPQPLSAADMPRHDATQRQTYTIYVDNDGVMRRSDTNQEVSYYGTNYTTPFAHAYRALAAIGADHKSTIDIDVAQMRRLGFNGFRLHLWDAELADSAGNLLQNEHLDLLDYLIAALEKQGIDIVLTAQTNFGNGYPDKDMDTGAFTYDFPKCGIHEDARAQAIQANYLQQLAEHVNPYTGLSYSADNAIIAMEVNNEPCHTGSTKQVTEYINKMVKALKKGGFKKPILYNVSHNPKVTPAYYDADIQGTTYQWYPTGLVANHQRYGNFLPAVDSYPIPWKESIKKYKGKARLVYEFDPGDVLYSYLYPAIARTFRKEGFQWITQFAYDPTPIAKNNTEYQTHFLNLLYTPAKAISMMIAGEATRTIPRGSDFGSYPQDTIFADFSVSYLRDLSQFNDGKKFYYTNTTADSPKNPATLEHIAGHGSSPAAGYDGSGAYFLDKIPGSNVWRLEVLPDVEILSDPFDHTSPYKEIAALFSTPHRLALSIPDLGENFSFVSPGKQATINGTAKGHTITVSPGIYFLADDAADISALLADSNAMKGIQAMYPKIVPDDLELGDASSQRYIQKHASRSPRRRYTVSNVTPNPAILLNPHKDDTDIDVVMIPEAWDFKWIPEMKAPVALNSFHLMANPENEGVMVVRKYVGDELATRDDLGHKQEIVVKVGATQGLDGTRVALVGKNGATYSATLPLTRLSDDYGPRTLRVPLSELVQTNTLIVPAPYPSFLPREVALPDMPFDVSAIDFVELIIPTQKDHPIDASFLGIWLE